MAKADILLVNANALTLDPYYPHAQFLAIHDGKILAVGSKDEQTGYIDSDTEIIDCQRMTMLPGFHDAHCHPVGYAETLVSPDLSKPMVHSILEIQNILGEVSKKTPPGSWIRARGYSEYYLKEKRHPNRYDLDQVTTDHPIKLSHRSGHAHVLNSLGLKVAGISVDTPEPPGSVIERDLNTGEPNGLLFEMGSYLANIVPLLSTDEIDRGIKLASRQLIALGITSIQDASSRNNVQRLKMFQRYKNNDLFKPRITMMIGSEYFSQFQELRLKVDLRNSNISLGAVKIIIQNATGELNPSQNELNEKVNAIHRSGFQVALHAMDKTSIDAACIALENALLNGRQRDRRHRIEHCSICDPITAKRMAKLGIVIATQPAFIYYNGERYLHTIPEDEIAELYPIGTLVKAGLKVAAGSDSPVIPPNPIYGIYSAISRLTETGEKITPSQGVSVMEALRMYTYNSAYSCFQEDTKGTLSPEKHADLILINGDPTRLPVNEIKDLEVKMTIIGGEIVWRKGL